jgi:hypothetical protein
MKQFFFLLLVLQIVTWSVYATEWVADSVVLLPTNTDPINDLFGGAVSVSGNQMAVGAKGADGGAVYTYAWSGSAWVADGVVLAPTALAASDYFGTSVSMSGTKLAVGAMYDDDAGSNAGAVYTFVWSGSAWVEDATVLLPTLPVAANDYFGHSVSMSGDKLAISAYADDGTGSDAGAVYTYVWSGSAWVADAAVLAPTNTATGDDYFGQSVSMSGDKLAIGSPYDDDAGADAGAVYTYVWSGSAWVADAVVLVPTYGTVAGDAFGNAVSVSGDKMAIGAYAAETAGADAGVVYTYVWSGSAWVADAAVLVPTNTDPINDYFGGTVSVSGNQMAVGAKGAGSNAGAVYTYAWSGSAWVEDSVVLAPTALAANDAFGGAISVNGDRLTVGAMYDDDAGSNAGSVYTFSIQPPTPSPTDAPTGSPTIGTPTESPSNSPTGTPTDSPTGSPTTAVPTVSPTIDTGTPLTVSTITYFVRDDEDRESVIEDLIAALAISFPDTSDYSVKKNIVSVETGIITQELITETNNNTLLEEKIKAIRCGNAVDSCTITINYGGGRRLTERELAAGIYIEITYEISSELLATVDGLDLDDPAFEQQLADALGISNLTNIEITSDGGEITISATLEALPNSDPLGAELLATAQALYTDMVDVTTALLIALGASDSELLSSNINLCAPDRDCSGNGSCNSYTGVCACVGNWWGINCETPCECFNGGECVKAFCHCKFPFFGLRCNNDSGCSTCNAPTPPPTPGGTSIPEAP